MLRPIQKRYYLSDKCFENNGPETRRQGSNFLRCHLGSDAFPAHSEVSRLWAQPSLSGLLIWKLITDSLVTAHVLRNWFHSWIALTLQLICKLMKGRDLAWSSFVPLLSPPPDRSQHGVLSHVIIYYSAWPLTLLITTKESIHHISILMC